MLVICLSVVIHACQLIGWFQKIPIPYQGNSKGEGGGGGVRSEFLEGKNRLSVNFSSL